MCVCVCVHVYVGAEGNQIESLLPQRDAAATSPGAPQQGQAGLLAVHPYSKRHTACMCMCVCMCVCLCVCICRVRPWKRGKALEQ